jgi:hypothetical protein
MDLPPSWKNRPVPTAIPAKNDLSALSWNKWVDNVERNMNPATGLPMTHPDTRRAFISDTDRVADIMLGLLRAGRVQSVEKIAAFYTQATHEGAWPVLLAYQNDTGAPVQFSDEWHLPGEAHQRASASVALARAFLELAKTTGEERHWRMAVNLMERSFDFNPDNDFFWFEGPASARARKLIEVWEPVRSDKSRPSDSAAELAFVTDQIEEARTALHETPNRADAIRKERMAAIINQLSSTDADRAALRNIFAVSGGFAEYMPRNPIIFRPLGVSLMPEPDFYQLNTNRDALFLLEAWRDVLNNTAQLPAWLIPFKTHIEVAGRSTQNGSPLHGDGQEAHGVLAYVGANGR